MVGGLRAQLLPLKQSHTFMEGEVLIYKNHSIGNTCMDALAG